MARLFRVRIPRPREYTNRSFTNKSILDNNNLAFACRCHFQYHNFDIVYLDFVGRNGSCWRTSTSGRSATGGRSMQGLATPGLSQLITPTTSSVTSTAPATPRIGQNPSSISFSAVQNGANPASQSVTITNTGTGTLSWTATSTAAWLSINGGSALSGTNSGSFNVGANISGLSIGNYTGSYLDCRGWSCQHTSIPGCHPGDHGSTDTNHWAQCNQHFIYRRARWK